MHYRDFLFENLNEYSQERSRTIAIEEVVKLIKTDYSEAWDKLNDGIAIYRGTVNNSDFFITDPSIGNRTSANTFNYYTAIIDNSKRWRGYPKRSKSVIGATTKSYSKRYGSTFYVLPINGSNIGVAPEEDFWKSFPIVNQRLAKLGLKVQNLHELNLIIKDLISIAVPNINPDIKGFSTLAKSLKEVDEFLNKKAYLKDGDIDKRLLKYAIGFFNTSSDDKINCLEDIDSILDPDDNGFKKFKLIDFAIRGDQEVWTDGKCLMISVDKLKSLKKLI
jgi:hypothetical protein